MLGLPAVIGHRGAAAYAPENSLEGFALAARLGCAMVEFDVRLTADRVPVVFHDDMLERLTGLTAPVGQTPFQVLRWHAPLVPTLAETLELCRSLDLAVNIEIKPDRGAEAATADLALAVTADLWRPDAPLPLISSFSAKALDRARQLRPDWPRGLLVGRLPADWLTRAKRLACASIHAEQSRLTEARIAAIAAHGMEVLAYTVNRRERAELLLQRGISALFSDHPDLLGGKSAAMS